MEASRRPKLIRRKAAKSVLTQACEKCSAQVNLHLVSTTPMKIWRGTCEACGQRAEKTGDEGLYSQYYSPIIFTSTRLRRPPSNSP
jgi:hypothetical protein